jgi:hypothetical protein
MTRHGRITKATGIIAAVFACGGVVYAANVGSMGSQADSNDPRNISGVWWASSYTRELRPASGEAIPFTPEGRAQYDKVQKDLRNGKLTDNARHICLPQGTPRVMTTAYPFLIAQTSDQITLIFEENRIYRIVRLDAKHADPELWDPSFMGDSIGRWDGQALVVDTTNFKLVTFLDNSHLPHSDKLEIGERFRKMNRGKTLEDLITITDPLVFTRPWTTRLTFVSRPDVEIQTDWVCGGPHRNISSVKGALR